MIKTISTGLNNDIFITTSRSLSMSSDIYAVANICENSVQTMLGELVLQGDVGVPNFTMIWNGTPNIPQAESALRDTILSVDGVSSVISLSAFVENNVLVYNATIQTIYGEVSLGL